MTREPIRLLESGELSETERSLLEAGRTVAPVHCDVAAGATRLRAAIDALATGHALAPAPLVLGTAKAVTALLVFARVLMPVLAVCAAYYLWRAERREPAPLPTEARPAFVAVPEPQPSAAPKTPTQAPAMIAPTPRESSPVRRQKPSRHNDKRARTNAPPSAAGVAPGSPAQSSDDLEELLERPRTANPAPQPVLKPTPVAEPTPAEPTPAEPTPAEPTPAEPTPATEPPPASDELHDIARARALLRSDPQAALDVLNRVGREHPRGYFVEERLALTVLALVGAGQHDLAASRATSFLGAYPKSPFADRVRAAVSR